MNIVSNPTKNGITIIEEHWRTLPDEVGTTNHLDGILINSAAVAIVGTAGPASLFAQPVTSAGGEEMSIEKLWNTEVTSVSRKPQPLSRTAAAVFVISAQDIRRSGLQSLPEVLRLAPGVQVSRVTSGAWAITIRGFDEILGNKLLVLVDGLSQYPDFFAGVM